MSKQYLPTAKDLVKLNKLLQKFQENSNLNHLL